MKKEIRIIYKLEALPIPSAQIIARLSGLAKVINPKAFGVSVPTLSRFFNHNGVLAIALGESCELMGMASIVPVVKISGITARLEHVAVFPQYERNGIGRILVLALIDVARKSGVRFVDLTCEPSREIANRLYEDLGFVLRTTNPRRLTF